MFPKLYVYIMLSWWLLVLTGVWPKELPEYAPQIRKVAQRCANWLGSLYSHVWSVCRVYGTQPNYPLGQYHRKLDWKDRSHHCISMFLHLTTIVRSLTYYFFKYSRHVLLHFLDYNKTFLYYDDIAFCLAKIIRFEPIKKLYRDDQDFRTISAFCLAKRFLDDYYVFNEFLLEKSMFCILKNSTRHLLLREVVES